MDALIVVGTALATSGAKSIVYKALDKMKIPVIEINMEPVIEEGFTLNVISKSEIALNDMFEEYYKLMKETGEKSI